MRVFALVGTSGSGKSHKALNIAYENNIECIIDDGLLIKDNKVLAGKSAKGEKTTISAVKRALFLKDEHRKEVVDKIREIQPESILILGTSERMVKQISERLEVGEITKIIFINEISTPNEINTALRLRKKEGKHVIPVPTFEIKKDFSGYFLNPLKIFQRRRNNNREHYHVSEKSVVRPTFSYLGKYLITDRALGQIIKYSCTEVLSLYKVLDINIKNYENGIVIDVDVILYYGSRLVDAIKEIQRKVKKEVEAMTSLNVISINIEVKSLYVKKR